MFEFERLNRWLDQNTPEQVERRNREYAPPWWFVLATAAVLVVFAAVMLSRGQTLGVGVLAIAAGWALAGLIIRSRVRRPLP